MDIDRLSIIESLETFIPHDRPTIEFDSIFPPCNILNVLSQKDIMDMNYIAKDRKLSGKPKEKQKLIKQIMMNRGFKKLAAGTNRLVFKYMEDQSFIIKVPFNSVGLRDNLDELYNQQFLKPFCTKVFEVSQCGTVGMFERVHGITNREEFQLLSGTIFDIIINKFIGQFVLADFGTKFFMNWGVRRNAYPILLDFPYLYELDGAKLYCNRPDPLSEHGFCGGEIDYDSGFNHLVCKKCGKTYLASELRLSENKKTKSILIEREDIGMIITISKGDKIICQTDTTKESDTYRRDKKGRKKETPLEYRERKRCEGFKISVTKVIENEEETNTTQQTPVQSNVQDEFNQGYSLNDIPNDIDQVYRTVVNVDIKKSRKDKGKRQEVTTIVTDLKDKEEQSKDTNQVSIESHSNEELEVVEPISREMYEMAQQIHTINDQEYIEQEEDNIQESDSDQNCGTSMSDLLKDVDIEEDQDTEYTRPANEKLIIQPRDTISNDEESINDNHIDEAFYD